MFRYVIDTQGGGMTVPSLTAAGSIPLGRWHATFDEVEAAFVIGQAAPRTEIWSEFVRATGFLQQIVRVCSVWLGGSFFTAKANPDDIDCVYLVDDRTKPTTPQESDVFDLFVGGGLLRRHTGIRVDSYVVPWIYRPGVDLDVDSQMPLLRRGYWDDLWQRERHGPKGSEQPADALPKRGYLEVIVDGYSPTA